jgi:hypothetical protein
MVMQHNQFDRNNSHKLKPTLRSGKPFCSDGLGLNYWSSDRVFELRFDPLISLTRM